MAVQRWKPLLLLFGAALSSLAIAACGTESESSSEAPDYARELAGSPAALAAIHEQADELLPGGLEAYEQRLEELQGFPVVVNAWASWCGPCRAEFPLLQQASADKGKQIAFLGINSQDEDEMAANFLADNPLSYPSYVDPDAKIAREIGATHGLPATAFYDAEGNRTYVKHGEFRDQADLNQHIQKYAVNGQTG